MIRPLIKKQEISHTHKEMVSMHYYRHPSIQGRVVHPFTHPSLLLL
nr:hypothetical protein Q903MT_gene4929 [Picea sitchensis]